MTYPAVGEPFLEYKWVAAFGDTFTPEAGWEVAGWVRLCFHGVGASAPKASFLLKRIIKQEEMMRLTKFELLPDGYATQANELLGIAIDMLNRHAGDPSSCGFTPYDDWGDLLRDLAVKESAKTGG